MSESFFFKVSKHTTLIQDSLPLAIYLESENQNEGNEVLDNDDDL